MGVASAAAGARAECGGNRSVWGISCYGERAAGGAGGASLRAGQYTDDAGRQPAVAALPNLKEYAAGRADWHLHTELRRGTAGRVRRGSEPCAERARAEQLPLALGVWRWRHEQRDFAEACVWRAG